MAQHHDDQTFFVYKGLQRPLVFKGFKGKFIYMGFGVATLALIACVIISTLFSFSMGGLTLVLILFGGILLIGIYQKKYGLYNKKVHNKILIVKSIFQS